MPTFCERFTFIRTYTCDAGSSPTRTVTKHGRRPVAAKNSATPSLTCASVSAARATPSINCAVMTSPLVAENAQADDVLGSLPGSFPTHASCVRSSYGDTHSRGHLKARIASLAWTKASTGDHEQTRQAHGARTVRPDRGSLTGLGCGAWSASEYSMVTSSSASTADLPVPDMPVTKTTTRSVPVVGEE